MANHIVVSSVGSPAPEMPSGSSLHQRCEIMADFWRREINWVLPDRPDLVVLPELCDQFLNEPLDDVRASQLERTALMRSMLGEIARAHRCYLLYPFARPLPDGSWRNSATLFNREGQTLGTYDKNHPVIVETTQMNILPGESAPLFECDFGKVAVAVCFDLNFEELRLKYAAARPDLILFPSKFHGGIMQAYWAFSCRAHFVGCVGLENLPSEIYSPVGHCVARSTNYFQSVTARINLDCQVVHLDGHWEKLRALKDFYGRSVTIFDPGQLGSVLVSSEDESVSVLQMMAEFKIQTLDDYLAGSRRHYRSFQPPGQVHSRS